MTRPDNPETRMNSLLSRTAASLALALPALAASAATPGEFGVKLRAAYLDTANNSAPFTALATNFAADSVLVESKWIPELDLTYAFTKNWVAEVVLTIPQEHDVTLVGVGHLGDFKHLPPTFSVVYEFMPEAKFRPYVSAGVNVTLIFDVNLSVAGIPLDLESSSIGLAAGAGFQADIADNWKFDASMKYIELNSNVSAGGAKLTRADLDPLLFSLGFVYSF